MFERSALLMNRKFREYLIPTILTNVAISLATVVDSIIVGNLLGETALSAIGLSAPVIYSLNALFVLFAIGGATSASIAKGKRDTESANLIFTLTFVAGMFAMLLLLTALLLFLRPITSSLAQGDALLAQLTLEYLKPLVFVGPAMMLIMGMAQFVRLDGNPAISAWIAVIANVVNLVLDYVFIKYLNMGITGAGLSTVLGYVTGIFVLLPYVFSKNRTFRFVRIIKSCVAHLRNIMGIGLPEALTQVLSFLSSFVLNLLIMGSTGSLGMAAMTVCINALMLTSMFISGTNETLLPLVGTLYGEKDYTGMRFTVRAGFKFMMVSSTAIMVFFLIAPGFVGRLFGINSQEGLLVVEPALRMYALCLPLYGINALLLSFFQTTGRVKLASIIVFLNGFAFVVLFAIIMVKWNGDYIWMAFLMAQMASFVFILGMEAVIRKKETVTGLLLLQRKEKAAPLLDLSIPATVEAAVELSEKLTAFCREHGAGGTGSTCMGVAVEEMAVNTARYGHKKKRGFIDVLLRITEKELVLRLRDDGILFNPVEYRTEEKEEFAVGGIEVVRRLAKDISYTRQLGFNVSLIKIPRDTLKEAVSSPSG